MEIINKKISELKPYEKNPRNNNKAVKYVANSIKEFGFKVPIVIDKNNKIVCGHTRYLASKEIGLNEVPCIVADDLTEEQINAFRLADNKVGEIATWDFELLNEEIDNILNIDMEDFGFELNLDILEVIEDEFNEDEVITRVKKGDIWKLGKHFLICGDSFKKETFEKLMKDKKADLGFCDPPYDLEKDEWVNNLEFIKKGSPILLMAGDKQTIRLANKIPNFRQFIIHDREQAMLVNTSTPMSQHTIISLFCDHPKKYFVNLNDHFTSVIRCKKNYSTAGDELHSKMGKPVKVISELISHYSKKEDIIIDYFGGGGSTIIACEQLERSCYCNELLEEQCDVILSRWEQFTGEKAEKIGGEENDW